MRKIYLAGGCFWGIQAYFARVSGVLESSVGYANSHIANPSYELVCSGISGAVEALELCYDEKRLGLGEIVDRLLAIIDPSALNYQGNDIGTQYRNGVYYLQECGGDLDIIIERIRLWEQRNARKAATEAMSLQNFYLAEPYHQNYLQANPQGYCHINIDSALKLWDTSSRDDCYSADTQNLNLAKIRSKER